MRPFGKQHPHQSFAATRGFRPIPRLLFLERLVVVMGCLLVFGLPFHLSLRLVTSNAWVYGWKEAVQLSGTLLVLVLVCFRSGNWWRVVGGAIFLLAAISLFAAGFDRDNLSNVYGLLQITGGSVAGLLGCYVFCEKITLSGRISLLLIISSSLVFSVGILLNDRLGLTYLFTPEQEAATPWYALREGIDRARFTMDSPMGAGQFLWLCSLLLAHLLVTDRRLGVRFLSLVGLILSSLALLKTGSRGPYVIFAASQIIYWLSLAWIGNREAKKLALLGLAGTALAGAVFWLNISDVHRRAYTQILASTGDSSESANNLRIQRIQEGMDSLRASWPYGYGLQGLSLRDSSIAQNFENHYFGYIVSLGILGLALVCLQFFVLVFATVVAVRRLRLLRERAALFLAMAVALLGYTFVFPLGQDRYGAILLWIVLGAGLGMLDQAGHSAARLHFKMRSAGGNPPLPIEGQKNPDLAPRLSS